MEGLIIRIAKVLNGFDGPDSGSLWWRTDDDYAPITYFINCNDLFHWACADCEEVNEENIHVLEEAYNDLKLVSGEAFNADILFCCRMRNMRPQKPYYKYINDKIKSFFDCCGPERDE